MAPITRRPAAAAVLTAALAAALAGCTQGALDDAPPAPSPTAPSASEPAPADPEPSEAPEGIDTSGWLSYETGEGTMSYRYPAAWTLSAESRPNGSDAPTIHPTWDSTELTAPNGQILLRSGDFVDIGGYCPPGAGSRLELLASEPSSVMPLDQSGESIIATLALARPDGGWTFGVGLTSTAFVDRDASCGVYFASWSSSGGVWMGSHSIVGAVEDDSPLWIVDSIDDAHAYMETEEYATILEILRSVRTS